MRWYSYTTRNNNNDFHINEGAALMDMLDFRIPSRKRLVKGSVIKGTVVSVGSQYVFIDIGTKSEACLDVKEITDSEGKVSVKVGDELEAYVLETEPEVMLSYGLARKHLNVEALEDAH